MSYLLILLALIPVCGFYLAKTYKPRQNWQWVGVAFGLVVAPVSLGLIKYAFIPVVGKLFGLVGVVLNLIHGPLGYFLMVSLGFEGSGLTLSASELTVINLINAVIWSFIYGIVGHHVDVKLAEEVTATEQRPVFDETVKQKVRS